MAPALRMTRSIKEKQPIFFPLPGPILRLYGGGIFTTYDWSCYLKSRAKPRSPTSQVRNRPTAIAGFIIPGPTLPPRNFPSLTTPTTDLSTDCRIAADGRLMTLDKVPSYQGLTFQVLLPTILGTEQTPTPTLHTS